MIATLLALSLFGGVTAQQHMTFTPAAGQLVRVETANGSIHVTTGGSKIVVTVTKKANAQADLGSLGVSVSKGSVLALHATFPNQCGNCSVDFDVTLPEGIPLELSSTNGSVTAAGLSADAKLASTNGSVSASYAVATPVRSIEMSSLNGSVNLVLPSGARLGHVSASTKVGSISSGWPLSIDKGMVGASVDQTLDAGGITLDLSTMNGSISIGKTQK